MRPTKKQKLSKVFPYYKHTYVTGVTIACPGETSAQKFKTEHVLESHFAQAPECAVAAQTKVLQC